MLEEGVKINNLEVNYKVGGAGAPLLILHGWGASSDSWQDIQKLLGREGYRVICPDFPGFGKSKTPLFPWNVTDYEKWVIDFADFLKLDKFSLLGHSFGGRIAIKLAVDYPERIEKLILSAPAGIKAKPDLKTRLIFTVAKIGNMLFTPKHLQRFRDRARNFFYSIVRKRDHGKVNGVMKEIIIKILEEDLSPYIQKINLKTLIVWGTADKMVPLRFAHIFHQNIKDSKLEILPKIGHSPHLETPEKLSKILVDFLKS